MKACTKCGLPEGEVTFYKCKKAGDGLTCACKGCLDAQAKTRRLSGVYKEKKPEYQRRYEERHPDRVRASYDRRYEKVKKTRAQARELRIKLALPVPTDRKTCAHCKAEKLLDQFSKQKCGPLGRRSRCRECDSKTRKPNDPVKIRLSERAWKQKNPGRAQRNHRNNEKIRRAARSIAYFTEEQWQALLNTTGRQCLCCGEPETSAIYSFRNGPQRGKLTPDHVIPVISGGTEDISNIQPLCLPCNMRKGTRMTDYRSVTFAVAA
jgi:hypothetical protein